MTADLSEAGLHLEVNISAVDPRCEGQLSLQYKSPIPPEVLTRLPRASLAFDVPPEYVFRAVGVPSTPKTVGFVAFGDAFDGEGFRRGQMLRDTGLAA